MARLYHKQVRRGAGRRGGYKKASPDPVSFANLPAYTASAASEPAYLGTVTDDVTGATIRKISDHTTFGTASTEWLGTDYSTHPVEIGVTGDYAMIGQADWAWAINGWRHSSPYSYIARNSAGGSDPFVSAVYPDRIWYIVNASAAFGYTNFNPSGGETTTPVKDFSATYDYLNGFQYEGAPSWDEDVWALIAHRASDDHWCVLSYRVSTDTIQGVWDTGIVDIAPAPSAPGEINWAHMSPLGNYVVVGTDGTVDGKAAGVHVFNASNMSYVHALTGGSSAHHDMQVLEDGRTEVLVEPTGSDLAYWVLSSNTKVTVVSNMLSQVTVDGDFHVSGRNIYRPGYVYVSFHSYGTQTLDNCVVAVRLSNGEIEKWCHAQQPATDSYDLQTRVVPSSDGKRVYWSAPSPWRTDVNATRCYVAIYQPSGT